VVKPDQNAFLASVVHELRAPLNACLMSVNLLELKASDPQVVLNSARVIRRNLDRQAALIRDLSDVVQIASDAVVLSREPVDVDALVDGVVEKARAEAAERGVEVGRGKVESSMRLETDAERAAQVLGSFLEHLLAGTRAGESVTVDARRADGEAEVTAARGAARAAGAAGAAGAEPNEDERRRDQKGFAVRLLVAEYLLERLGGRCERRPDGFSVHLPLS
jgi:signal transduction histidine kinase